MKKTIAWLLVVLMLCPALGLNALAAGNEICGTWYLVNMDDGSGEDYTEMLSTMSALGIYASLEIREDGTATINLFDETEDFKVDFKAKKFIVDDDELSYIYKDGILTFGDDETTMTFSREEPNAPAGSGAKPFDYYEFIDMKEYDGTLSDIPPELVNLLIFDDGSAVLTSGTTVLEMTFDFDTMEITSDGDKIGEFTLEDDVLTIDDGEYILRFRLGDPGFAGSYILTDLINEDGKTMTDELSALSALNMLPTLTIGEDGEGVLTVGGEQTEMHFDFDKMLVTGDDEDDAIAFAYENGCIKMENDGGSMTFRRVLAQEDTETDAAPEAEEAPVEERTHTGKDKG